MRYKFHIAGVLILVIISIILVLSDNRLGGTRDTHFSVNGKHEIQRVDIERGNLHVTLSMKNGDWIVNNKWPARKEETDLLLGMLRRIEVKSPVSDEIMKSVTGDKKTEPVRVKVYGSRRLLTTFLVYLSEEVPGGNIMKKSHGSRPYIIHLPGYSLNPGAHFVADVRFWRPFLVFDIEDKKIDFISLTYGNLGTPDIFISVEGSGYDIRLNGRRPPKADTLNIRRYLAYFSYVPFEAWAVDITEAEKRSVISQPPEFIIRVGLAGVDTVTFTGWRRQVTTGNTIEYDTDRIWGSINGGGDIFIARYFDIDPVLKRIDYFYTD